MRRCLRMHEVRAQAGVWVSAPTRMKARALKWVSAPHYAPQESQGSDSMNAWFRACARSRAIYEI